MTGSIVLHQTKPELSPRHDDQYGEDHHFHDDAPSHFIANGFVAVGCHSCLLYTKKVLLQTVLMCPNFALNKSYLVR